MTFGGLALGSAMIVDAAIVVLENSFRHMEHHGKESDDGVDRRQRGSVVGDSVVHPDPHRVFVPLLFLTGVSSLMVPAAVGRRGVLTVDVAVRGRDAGSVLCSKLLVLPAAPRQSARASAAGFTHSASAR